MFANGCAELTLTVDVQNVDIPQAGDSGGHAALLTSSGVLLLMSVLALYLWRHGKERAIR